MNKNNLIIFDPLGEIKKIALEIDEILKEKASSKNGS